VTERINEGTQPRVATAGADLPSKSGHLCATTPSNNHELADLLTRTNLGDRFR